MDTLGIIGMILMIFGFASAAWVAILFVLSLSAIAGTKISKKIGNANENTDEHLENGKSITNNLLKKLIWRFAIGCIGWLSFYIATGHA